MKKYLLIFTVTLMTTAWGCTEETGEIPPFIDEPGSETSKPDPDDPDDPDEPDEPTYLFFEDFTSEKINARKWKPCDWAEPNWAYFMGHFDLDGIPVSDGNLYLRAVDPLLYGDTLNKDEIAAGSDRKFYPWCMGMWTRGQFGFRYGEVQVRAKFSKTGDGSWPAIWLMPTDDATVEWPGGGEIDIMERWDTRDHIVHSVHYLRGSGASYTTKSVYEGQAEGLNLDDFNVYGVRKTPGKLEFTINGNVTLTVTREEIESGGGNWPYEDHDYYIILNYACSATERYFINNWSGNYLPSTETLPYEMVVDYVSVTSIAE